MSNIIIGVDVDDVCADLLTPWMRRLQARTGVAVSAESLTSWDIGSHLPEDKQWAVRATLDEVNYLEEVKPIYGALQAVRDLRKIGRVVFITSCPRMVSALNKYHWLIMHGFLTSSIDGTASQSDFFPARDKSLVHCDVLFDDGTHNLKAMQDQIRFACLPVLVKRAHNRSDWGQFPEEVNGLHEAPALVKGYFELGN